MYAAKPFQAMRGFHVDSRQRPIFGRLVWSHPQSGSIRIVVASEETPFVHVSSSFKCTVGHFTLYVLRKLYVKFVPLLIALGMRITVFK